MKEYNLVTVGNDVYCGSFRIAASPLICYLLGYESNVQIVKE